jgi:predicted AAA+ superfamily ATPase
MDQGLRLIEVDKDELLTIADLLAYLSELSGVGLSFILFLDDLSFAEDDTRYTILKTLLEGGVKIRPDHVAIYATSNRRHLVAEIESKELYANDASDEKLSLSDRFGISIRFSRESEAYLQTCSES